MIKNNYNQQCWNLFLSTELKMWKKRNDSDKYFS